jgi:hypothetical protein
MSLVAGIAALAVLGLLALLKTSTQAPAVEDEPPSRPATAPPPVSVAVRVTAIIREDAAAIVAFAPPCSDSRPLWELPDREWGVVTFQSPTPSVLAILEGWERCGEALLLESFPDRNLVRLSDPDGPQAPLVLSAA